MKRFFSITGILTLTAFFLLSFSLRENPQDPPGGEKTERHIKIVKVDEQGNKIELDTVLTNDDVFVWNGDTIGGGEELTWISGDDFFLDSLNEDLNIEYNMSEDESGNVFIMRSGTKGSPQIFKYKAENDSTKEYRIEIIGDNLPGEHDVLFWNENAGSSQMMVAPRIPDIPLPVTAPNVMFFKDEKSANIIDLSDPGIISFKKKKMSGGREKITIVRNEVDEQNIEKVEEIIVNGNGDRSAFFGGVPGFQKVIVTKNGEGKIDILENEDIFDLNVDGETLKVIQEDGKTVRIKKIIEGDERKVEVEIEEEVEVESDENN